MQITGSVGVENARQPFGRQSVGTEIKATHTRASSSITNFGKEFFQKHRTNEKGMKIQR